VDLFSGMSLSQASASMPWETADVSADPFAGWPAESGTSHGASRQSQRQPSGMAAAPMRPKPAAAGSSWHPSFPAVTSQAPMQPTGEFLVRYIFHKHGVPR